MMGESATLLPRQRASRSSRVWAKDTSSDIPLLCAFNETLAERHASKPQPSKAGGFLDMKRYTEILARAAGVSHRSGSPMLTLKITNAA